MPKRKHSDLDTKPTVTNDATGRIANRLSVKFDYEVNVLSRALKVSRGFEKQKMGRRGKKARSEEGAKPGTVGRIEEENKILKALDMDKTASKYILKQLARTKRIAEAPAFIYFRENLKKNISLDGPQSAAEGNVLARLYKSNPVKEVFPGIMEGFRKLLGLDAPAGKQEKNVTSGSAPRGDSEGKEGKQSKPKVKDEDAVEERDIDMDMGEEAASGSEDSEDFAQFNSRLAGSDSESESDDDNDRLDPMAISPSPSRSSSPDLDLDLESEPSPSPSASPEPEPSPAKKTKTKAASSKEPLTSTTFLPSLSMGGYVSGSESEPSDDEDSQPRRKNRMGQQARRALWEKKFGSRANHVKMQAAKEKRNRDSGWDVRRGATGGGKGAATGANREMRGNRLQRDGENKRKEPVDDKPMHPSWEAARKAKEAQASTAAFKGKKVTFD